MDLHPIDLSQFQFENNQAKQFEYLNQLYYKLKDKYGFSSLVVMTNIGVSALSIALLYFVIKY